MLSLQYDPSTNPLNNNEWSFPLFECIHIAMFAMSIGTIAVVDFRLLGLTLRRQSPVELLKASSLWTLIGLVVVITSGLVIFSSDPVRYYYNPAMRYKLIALVVAIVYNYTIHRQAILSNAGPLAKGLVAAVSLALWISIVFAGIFYSFV
ncbi:MAG TPA: DUF6644 family protein [Candidatus Acidoferrales bacterium]|nr:DUF6644 family protein [Candidatus Acidoferrales bacterium]